MSQFIDTNHANQAAKEAFAGYRLDTEKIKSIKERLKNGELVSTEELLWVCQRAEWGIRQEESSWFDHG
jgi:uncharacterized coiled-coil DUF342 family protein